MTVIGIAYAIFPGLTISAAVPSIVQDKKNQIRLPVGTNQLEKVLQGPSGSEEVYTMPFTKESKIDL